MKTYTFSFVAVMLMCFSSFSIQAQTTVNYTTAGTDQFIVPAGVTSIDIEVWGAGGCGGKRTSTGRAGGGGGGAYSKTTAFSVNPSDIIYINVGAGGDGSAASPTAGGDSWTSVNITVPTNLSEGVLAKGGGSVPNNTVDGANGGDASAGIGALKFSGGKGFTVSGTTNSGGGSSAGTAANGNDATGLNGATAPTGGGNGGNGNSGTGSAPGSPGAAPGGGGGAARSTTNNIANGGNGGTGKVSITYTTGGPATSITTSAISGSPFCVTASTGASVNVPFTTTGTFGGSNTFTAQLSNASGSFASFTTIGSGTSSPISATIPVGTTAGTGYRIRVVADDPVTTGTDNGANLTIVAAPENITALSGSSGDTEVPLSWSNPTNCFNEILVVASTSSIGGPPSGSYTANANYGSGTALLGGFVVYSGTGNNVTITGLTNGTLYYFKVFTLFGSDWNAGVQTSITPVEPPDPGDVLIGWDLAGAASNAVSNTAIYFANGIAVAPTSGVLTRGSGLTTAPGTDRFSARNFPPGSSINDAVAANSYFTFSVTPDAGYLINFSFFNFTFVKGNATSSPDKLLLRTSTDGFSTFQSFGEIDLANTTNAQFISIITPGLINISTPIEFRLYGYDASNDLSSGSFFDNASSLNAPYDVAVLGTAIPNTWTGNINSTWNEGDNWSIGTEPNLNMDALIPDVSLASNNFPIVSGVLNFAVKNISIESGAFITYSNVAILEVYGDFENEGIADFTTGELRLKGSDKTISGNLNVGILNIQGNTTIQPGSQVNVYEILQLENGQLTTNNSITLKSSAAKTAFVQDFGTGFTGNMNAGNNQLTIERYVPAGGVNNFHYIGSATGNKASIWADDFTNGATTANDGTKVTPKPDCDPLSLAAGSVYGNLFTYDESKVSTCYLDGWHVRTTNADADRGLGFAARINGGVILDETGAYSKANVPMNILTITSSNQVATSKGFHLVANPFFAPINWRAMAALPTNNNVDGTAYVYNPVTGTYKEYNIITGDTIIASNMAFFVNGLSGTSFNLLFDASTRITSGNQLFLRQEEPYDYLLKIKAESGNKSNETRIVFGEHFSDGYDNGYDAVKLLSSHGIPSVYTLDAENKRRGIEALGIPTELRTVPLGLLVPGAGGSYTLTFEGIEDFPTTSIVWLEDLKTGTIQYLRQSNTYTFSHQPTDNPDRFLLHFAPELQVATLAANCNGQNGIIQLVQSGGIEWSMRIKNASNMMLASLTFEGQQNFENLSPGIYTLELTHSVSGYSTSVQVEVNGLTPVEASILTSENLVYENEIILFEAQATGATDYEWSLGDGNIISGQATFAHAYAMEGMYEVTLTVLNSECQTMSSQMITVSKQEISTSVYETTAGEIKVYASGNEIFIKQNQMPVLMVTSLEIYNNIGQRIFQERDTELGYNQIKTIRLNVSAGVYFIKIHSNENEYVTKLRIQD